MKTLKFSAPLSIGIAAVLLPLAGCQKETPADATQSLQETFAVAEPQVVQRIDAVNSSLKAGNYAEATRALETIVSGQRLNDPQKQAVGMALQQINQAIAADPNLDTKEMYELRAKMFQAVRSGSRF
jgi:hypothetical protein